MWFSNVTLTLSARNTLNTGIPTIFYLRPPDPLSPIQIEILRPHELVSTVDRLDISAIVRHHYLLGSSFATLPRLPTVAYKRLVRRNSGHPPPVIPIFPGSQGVPRKVQ